MDTVKVHFCRFCGKSFYPTRNRRPPTKFCSSICAYHGTIKTFHCLECNTEFRTRQLMRAKFCSQQCRKTFARKEKIKNRIPKPCLTCGIDLYHGRLPKHPQYCSKACYFKSTEINRICLTCQQPFRTNTGMRRRRHKDYCSISCRNKTLCKLCATPVYGKNTQRRRPVEFCSQLCGSLYTMALQSQRKYKVKGYVATLQRIGKIACEECGYADRFALDVHHIDHNRKHNSFDNLQTLCALCHVKKHRHLSRNNHRDMQTALLLFERLEMGKNALRQEPEQLLLLT